MQLDPALTYYLSLNKIVFLDAKYDQRATGDTYFKQYSPHVGICPSDRDLNKIQEYIYWLRIWYIRLEI